MPNWCLNKGTIFCQDDEVLNEIRRRITCLDNIISCPNAHHENQIEWNTANWGTKWDVDFLLEFDAANLHTLTFSFNTAWAPPLMAFAHLSLRFPSIKIDFLYREDGMLLMGVVCFTMGRIIKNDIIGGFYYKTSRVYDALLTSFLEPIRSLLVQEIEEANDFHLEYVKECEENREEPIFDDELLVIDESEDLILNWMNFQYDFYNPIFRPVEIVGVSLLKKYVLKIKRISEVPEDWECGICREGKDERPVLKLRCGGDHIFHSICAKEWGKTKLKRKERTTCPMCVQVVSSTSSQEPESQQTPIGMDIE